MQSRQTHHANHNKIVIGQQLLSQNQCSLGMICVAMIKLFSASSGKKHLWMSDDHVAGPCCQSPIHTVAAARLLLSASHFDSLCPPPTVNQLLPKQMPVHKPQSTTFECVLWGKKMKCSPLSRGWTVFWKERMFCGALFLCLSQN